MKSKQKRWTIALLGAILIIVIVLIIALLTNKKMDNGEQSTESQASEQEKYTTQLEDGTKINTSEEFNNTKMYGDLEISNIQYTEKDGMSVLLADVKNNGTTTHEEEIVKITILGENEEIIEEIKPVIGKIGPGESIKLNASITADVANAKDFKIEASNE